MISDEIRQKAREYCKSKQYLVGDDTITPELTEDDLAAFAESLLPAGSVVVTHEAMSADELLAQYDEEHHDWLEERTNEWHQVRSIVLRRLINTAPPAAYPQPHGDIRENVLKRIEAIQAMRFPQAIAEYTDREHWQLALGELLWVERMFERAVFGGRHSVIVTKNAAELLQAASGGGTPATPSTPDKLYRRIPAGEDFPHGLLQEVDISTEIAAAVECEREACAKLAESKANLQTAEGVVASNIAAAIRSRASQPTTPVPECLDYPVCDGILAGEPHVKECPMYKSVAEGPAAKEKP